MVLEGAQNSLKRLYPQFHVADHTGWGKVYEKAQKGAPDALKAVGDEGEPGKNPVCKAILGYIGGGKKGADIRSHFEDAEFGWSRDAVDGGLQVLLVAGLIRAHDERGQSIDPKDLERKAIGKATFKIESATVTTAQRIQIRKLLQRAGLSIKQGEELAHAPQFLQKLKDLADRAGGEPPKPQRPDTSSLDEIRLTSGNEKLLALYNRRDELAQAIDDWSQLALGIEKRWPAWVKLTRLIQHAQGIQDAEAVSAQVKNIDQYRQLLEEPDPITPLINNLTQLLRDALNRLDGQYKDLHAKGMETLHADPNWKKLEPEQRNELLEGQHLTLSAWPEIKLGSTDEILSTLDRYSLATLADRVAAIPARFGKAAEDAAELLEPKIQFIAAPKRTLVTEDDINKWLDEVGQKMKAALKNGPVMMK
jgi:hypothetical protein